MARAKNNGENAGPPPIFAKRIRKRRGGGRGMETRMGDRKKGDGTGQIAASCPVTITCVCHESRWCIRSRLARSRASAKTEFSLCVSPRSVFVSANRLSPSLSHPACFLPISLFLSLSLSFSLSPSLLYFPSNERSPVLIPLARSCPARAFHLFPARSQPRARQPKPYLR